MTPVPEPTADVQAQIRAMLDAAHPKRAVLVVPGNEDAIPHIPTPLGVFRVLRTPGTLLTRHEGCAEVYEEHWDDEYALASILDYPEDKDTVVRVCDGDPVNRARAVQARDADGNVVTEAFCSPRRFEETMARMAVHGAVVVLTPTESIVRRIGLRSLEHRNG